MLINNKRRCFMNKKSLKNKIILQKITLNLLLKFLSPRNKFVIYISQSLDEHVWRYQNLIYKKYKRKHLNKYSISKSKAAWHEKNTSKLRCFILINSQHAGRLNIHTCNSQVGSAQFASAIFWSYEARHPQTCCKSRKYNVGWTS